MLAQLLHVLRRSPEVGDVENDLDRNRDRDHNKVGDVLLGR